METLREHSIIHIAIKKKIKNPQQDQTDTLPQKRLPLMLFEKNCTLQKWHMTYSIRNTQIWQPPKMLPYKKHTLQKNCGHRILKSSFSHSRVIKLLFSCACRGVGVQVPLTLTKQWFVGRQLFRGSHWRYSIKKICSQKFCNIHRKTPVLESLFK